MTKENLRKQYVRWLKNHSGSTPPLFPTKPMLLVAKDKRASTRHLTSEAVYAQCLYDCCERIHLFVILENITWKLDNKGNAKGMAARSYRVLFSS